MSVNTWEDVCEYLWEGPLTGFIYRYKIEGDVVYYTNSTYLGVWTKWVSVHTNPRCVYDCYLQRGRNPDHVSYTPQEKVCKKIALMESRWKAYQLRKQYAG